MPAVFRWSAYCGTTSGTWFGYDDSQFARLSYMQLSSVSQDAPLLAATAVKQAVDRIEKSQQPSHVVRAPHLVVRTSTAAPRDGEHRKHAG